MRTRSIVVLLATFCGLGATTGLADPAASPITTPILGQLVSFSLPSTFVMQKEQTDADRYFRAALPKGETLDTWAQMISVTGAKNAERDPKKTAQFIAANIATSIEKLCPQTFSVKPLGPSKINSFDTFVAVTSCGKVGPDQHSETAMTVAIKSDNAIYTIQWAERTASSAENLTIDEAKWKSRLKQLVPIHVCPIVAGEKPPYPSCGKT